MARRSDELERKIYFFRSICFDIGDESLIDFNCLNALDFIEKTKFEDGTRYLTDRDENDLCIKRIGDAPSIEGPLPAVRFSKIRRTGLPEQEVENTGVFNSLEFFEDGTGIVDTTYNGFLP